MGAGHGCSVVAERCLRDIFEIPAGRKGLSLAFDALSTHPQQNCGDSSWARAYVHVFRSPHFRAELIPVHRLASIGCGNAYEQCREAVEAFSNNHERRFSVMQGEAGTPGGMATRLGFDLTQLLMRTQPRGISSHLHYCWVYRGKIILKTNDHVQMGPWTVLDAGSGVTQDEAACKASPVERASMDEGATVFKMPRLAASWNELVTFLDATGAKADGCVA